MKKTSYLLFLLSWLVACTSSSDCIDAPELTNEDKVEVHIERLEPAFFNLPNPGQVEDFIKTHPVLAEEFLGRSMYPSDSILAYELFKRINNPYTDTLYQETMQVFADLSPLEHQFSEAFSRLKHYYPQFKAPQIKTMVTGFASSEMYVGNNQVIIGLDYYLGEGARYRPPGIPNYILKRFQPEYIVPAVVLLYANNYLKENPADQTMLADMVYYGKKYYFARQMLPCTNDSLIVWYTGQQLHDVEANKDVIWFHFLNNELLYETNHFVKQKYLNERPNVGEIGEKCPGRIGAWVGLDIIRAYMQHHPEITLQELMANPDAKAILTQSKYKVF